MTEISNGYKYLDAVAWFTLPFQPVVVLKQLIMLSYVTLFHARGGFCMAL